MRPQLDTSISHLKQLEPFEWYKRFPKDYYLATSLSKVTVIFHWDSNDLQALAVRPPFSAPFMSSAHQRRACYTKTVTWNK
ncbi:hypothetical protein BDV93DRAFT_567166 [Ceratobasidium sp. AG-I]|nr:hypothetical protein BDV93DRAFT_567166 [Ceratobasidium sp. AG-I]